MTLLEEKIVLLALEIVIRSEKLINKPVSRYSITYRLSENLLDLNTL